MSSNNTIAWITPVTVADNHLLWFTCSALGGYRFFLFEEDSFIAPHVAEDPCLVY